MLDGGRKGKRVAHRYQGAGTGDQLRQPSNISGHNGKTCRQGLLDHKAL